MFAVCLWSEDDFLGGQISEWYELPYLGCFLLIGSSITVTACHHCLGFEISKYFLAVTVVLGSGFVVLQMYEFFDCECDLLNNTYCATSFSTVGLHFMHVFLGLVALSVILFLGLNKISVHYINMGVWYWHFVDYIWLLVFTIVYLS